MNNQIRQFNALKLFFSIIACVVLVSCTLPVQRSSQIIESGPASVEIVYPEDGARLNAGETIDVVSNLTIPGGASVQILNVTDQISRTDPFVSPFKSGKVYQPWTPPGPGEYVLHVIIETTTGEALISNRITVYVGEQLVPSYTPTGVTVTTTPTATFTATPTLMTTTPEDALATADTDLNCRYGPGSGYDIVDGLREGETSPVIGVNEQRTWYLIAGPHGPTQCWVLAEYITLNRDISQYPVYPAPPLPDIDTHTPTPTITLITPSMTPTNTPGG
ncbi:MAG: hypothetical protein MUO76_06615, partial [Anaerolineaceae bacterium]|nr:hypothetical protein [Anaerolineaceae bacterium]